MKLFLSQTTSPYPAGIRRPTLTAGFTLIELLTVIAIIGVLSSVLVPVVSAVREKANAVRCTSNVRQIALAGFLYAQDHGVLPGWKAGTDRKELLYDYLHTGRSNMDTVGDQIWHCPSNIQTDREASYGFNTYLNWQPLEAVRTPSYTVAVADAGIKDSLEPTLATHLMPPSTLTNSTLARPNPRHNNRGRPAVSVAFVDGHARLMPIEAPFYPDVPGKWFGNGITDLHDPAYKDEMWDLN